MDTEELLRESYPRFTKVYELLSSFAIVGAFALPCCTLNPEFYNPLCSTACVCYMCAYIVAAIVKRFLAADVEQCELIREADERAARRMS